MAWLKFIMLTSNIVTFHLGYYKLFAATTKINFMCICSHIFSRFNEIDCLKQHFDFAAHDIFLVKIQNRIVHFPANIFQKSLIKLNDVRVLSTIYGHQKWKCTIFAEINYSSKHSANTNRHVKCWHKIRVPAQGARTRLNAPNEMVPRYRADIGRSLDAPENHLE